MGGPRLLILVLAVGIIAIPGTVSGLGARYAVGNWVLVETKVNPDGTSLEKNSSNYYGTTIHKATLTESSYTKTLIHLDPDGVEDYRVDSWWEFGPPPPKLTVYLSKEDPVEFAVKGGITAENVPYDVASGITVGKSYTSSTSPFLHGETLWIGDRYEPTDSKTFSFTPGPPANAPLEDAGYKIQIVLDSTFFDGPVQVQWIYRLEGYELVEEGSLETPVPEETHTATPTNDDVTEGSPGEFVPSGPFNADCSLKGDEFERDWLKYSDFDVAIPVESRSYEAKQFHSTLDEATGLMLEAYLLERDMEMDRLTRLELRNVRTALVRNLRQNLMKSFIRLSWVTYDTIKAGVRGGTSYGKVVADAEATGLQQVLAATNAIRANVPKNSSISIDTNTTRGKFMSAGLGATMTALDFAAEGDFSYYANGKTGTKIGADLFAEGVKGAGLIPPGPELTQADVDLLKGQYERSRDLDKALARSYRLNADRRHRVNEIEEELKALREEADGWESKERERVQLVLEEDCKQQKKRFEEGR